MISMMRVRAILWKDLRVNQLLTATINVETRLREVLLSGEEECLAPCDSGRIFR